MHLIRAGSPSTRTYLRTATNLAFSAAQTAGNLNVVVVGWNDTQAAVLSVSDTAGNVYTRAIGPTLGSGLSQSIYYAKNIAAATAGSNHVTVRKRSLENPGGSLAQG